MENENDGREGAPGNTALVTGATGFVGSHLTRRLLRDGWSVHAVVREGKTFPAMSGFAEVRQHAYDGTLDSVLGAMEQARPRVVFHLASLFIAQHQPGDLDRLLASNVLFGAQLLEAMAAAGATRLVNTGSSWQHFRGPEYQPVNLYAATKQALEDIIRYYVDAHGLRCITLKLFDTYGPEDRRPKLLNLLLEAARTGEPLGLSPGEQIVDMTYVDDVVEAFLVASRMVVEGRGPACQAFAVSGGERVSLRDLVKIWEEVLGAPIPVTWGARPYREREVMVPASCAEGLPGWRPRFSLRQGLSRVAQSSRS